MSVKVGQLTAPASTGNQSYSGFGFQPKAVIFWGAATGTTGSEVDDFGMGWGVSDGTNEVCMGSVSDDNAGVSIVSAWAFSNFPYAMYDPTNSTTTSKILLDALTMDSDGFTVNWSTTTSGWKVNYLAVGGGSVQAKVGTFGPAQGGSHSVAVTGVGFQPEYVIILASPRESSTGAARTNAELCMGHANATQQMCSGYYAQDAANTMVTASWQFNSSVLRLYADGSLQYAATLSSFDSDGFTLSFSNSSGQINNGPFMYLALRGVSTSITEQLYSNVGDTNVAITGMGFLPEVVMNQTNNDPTLNASNPVAQFCFGAGNNNSTGQADAAAWDNDGIGTSNNLQYTANDQMIHTMVNQYAQQFVSLDSDGYTYRCTSAIATSGRRMITVGLKTTAAGPANVKTFDGVAAASIKTYFGVATASVKSVNGIT